jgi:hypothetical protein
MCINISAKKSSRSDWGSNPRPTATPPSTKYQRSNPLNQIAIRFIKRMVLWTVASQAWYLVHVTWLTQENFSTHNAFSSIALVYYSESGRLSPPAQGEYASIYINISAKKSSRSDWSNPATRMLVNKFVWWLILIVGFILILNTQYSVDVCVTSHHQSLPWGNLLYGS